METKKYYTEKTYNTLGDLSTIKYFTDVENGVYINLEKKEIYTANRDVNTGLVISIGITTEYYKGKEIIETDFNEKYLNTIEAIEYNQSSRNYLILKASDYLLNNLIAEYGKETGLTNAITFLNSVTSEREKYILGIKDYLIQAIENSAYDFLTTERKQGLLDIVNVSY